MANLFRRFRALLPQDPVLYAEVIAVHTDGTSTVEGPAGNQYRVRGDSVAAGAFAYIQRGRITDEAPALTFHAVTV